MLLRPAGGEFLSDYSGKEGLFKAWQPLAAIATTPQSWQRLQSLPGITAATLWVPPSLADLAAQTQVQVYSGSLLDHLAALWDSHRGFIFGLATGAVVRLVAPLLRDKSTDPAVIVVDASGKFVISLCSGHQGGGDRLAQLLASELGATPVITGAAESLGLVGIDILGQPFGWQRGPGDWLAVSAALAHSKPVQVIQEAGSRLWQQHLPQGHSFVFTAADQLISSPPEPGIAAQVWIGPRDCPRPATFSPATLPQVQWHPRVLWLGIGCERGTPQRVIATAIQQVCQQFQWAEAAIAGVGTLDLKADEIGLLDLCQQRQWPLRCFTAEQLRQVEVPHPSAIVAAEVGTGSVAEAAALWAVAQQEMAARGLAEGLAEGFSQPQFSLPGTDRLRVPKQIFRMAGQPGAVTVAIAQAETEYNPRLGQLWLVGTGPGRLDQITPAAQTAVVQADVVIGYSLYIDLLRPILRAGQIVEGLPITQERQRALRAIALAKRGLSVAVVSSGDAGIYGMAGLVLEELQCQDWDGTTPAVQVFPGVSAVQAAASRVGTPLMHDFCTISLSDRLTPWAVIEQRVIAAAQADFVTALYNPRSQTRIEPLQQTQQIFLQYRSSATPVAIVRSAYRQDEQLYLTTLEKLLLTEIDMLTIVIIGNASTQIYRGKWMITPRGYAVLRSGDQ
jgi:cobalt-precorrin 5A hydrolase / precorrin-3B C17-methyltransferase